MNNLAERILILFSILIAIPTIILGLLGSAILLFLGKVSRSDLLWKYGFNIAYSIDQFGNALLLGDPNETISSRTGRALLSGKPKWFVKPLEIIIDTLALLFNDENHVKKSVETDTIIKKELWPWVKG